MFYFGPAGIPARCKGYEEAFDYLRQLGLNAMELEFVRGARMSLDRATEVGEQAEKQGIRLSAHAPYFINLNSKEKEKVEKSIAHIVKTAQVASAARASPVVVHAGYYSGKKPPEATEIITANLERCIEEIEEGGANNTIIGLETMGRVSAWGTLDEILEVCSRFKNVVPVVDFAHMYARTNGQIRNEEGFEEIVRKFETGGYPFMHVHMSSIAYTAKGERMHLSMEQSSEPDFRIIARVLKKRRYPITIISESPVLELDALKMKKIVEETP
ncbi:MAG: TIM barrel protein [Thermoplasmata archaeon]|nr:TIM barrel protein [Thermoplasmata archaeon]